MAGREHRNPPFRSDGILGVIRHPWYTGTILFLVFSLPVTDVNWVWRVVFLLYTIIGTELEERKLLVEIGDQYRDYRRNVPRFFPGLLFLKKTRNSISPHAETDDNANSNKRD